MFQKEFDITDCKQIKIQCPYCDLVHEYEVEDSEYRIENCRNDAFICQQPFVLSVVLISETTTGKEFALITCRKIEDLFGGICKIKTEVVRNFG